MKQNWKKIHSSNAKIVWLNSINNETKICYLTYEDGKTPLPKGWKRWFSSTYQLFYYTYIDNNGRKQIKWSPSKFNQYDYSPKEEPKTFDLDLEDDLEDDLKRIYDIADGDINLKWHGNIIPCILEKVDDKINIRILGKNDCLDFSIFKDGTAYIDLLSILENNCPGPDNGKGSFFLGLVDEICRRLEIKTLELVDQSTIKSKDDLRVSLEFLSLMKHGLSWYERHGFSYKDQRRKDIVNKIRNTPISKIEEVFLDFASDLVADPEKVKDKLKKKVLENWYRNNPEFREEKILIENWYRKAPELKYAESLEAFFIKNKDSYDKNYTPLKNFMFKIKRFLNLKLNFNKIDYGFSELSSKIYNTLRIIEEYRTNKEKSDSLSGFLTYVWDKNNSNNFREYIEILSLLYPNSEEKIYIEESILPAFPADTGMIKVFSM
jgi:hypothetical protein